MAGITTTRYKVTIPRKGSTVVNAYNSMFAAVQGENTLRCTAKWAWVRQIVHGRVLKAERVVLFHGCGR